jgi:serine/threonine protein kinase
VIHRDIKPSNIFIEKSPTHHFHVYLRDFGSGKKFQTTINKSYVGTEDYMSPEMKAKLPYTSKTDLFSLGCVLYELMSLKHLPMAARMMLDLMNGIDSFSELKKSCFNYSEELHKIMKTLLQIKPEDRSSAADLLENPIFDQFRISVQKPTDTTEKLCRVCMEKIPLYVLRPCGHFLCEECKDKVDTCPMCRKKITSTMKTYP